MLCDEGTQALRLLLHPYLRWTLADSTVVRGRVTVLALLDAEPPKHVPRVTELRNDQIYRWDSSA